MGKALAGDLRVMVERKLQRDLRAVLSPGLRGYLLVEVEHGVSHQVWPVSWGVEHQVSEKTRR